jgi:hypothetical protein
MVDLIVYIFLWITGNYTLSYLWWEVQFGRFSYDERLVSKAMRIFIYGICDLRDDSVFGSRQYRVLQLLLGSLGLALFCWAIIWLTHLILLTAFLVIVPAFLVYELLTLPIRLILPSPSPLLEFIRSSVTKNHD